MSAKQPLTFSVRFAFIHREKHAGQIQICCKGWDAEGQTGYLFALSHPLEFRQHLKYEI